MEASIRMEGLGRESPIQFARLKQDLSAALHVMELPTRFEASRIAGSLNLGILGGKGKLGETAHHWDNPTINFQPHIFLNMFALQLATVHLMPAFH